MTRFRYLIAAGLLIVGVAAWLAGSRQAGGQGTAPHRNRLANEKSPYLLQHATNPVDWFPWGEEAFARARELGRPILLSIGYSTCHWCHVMERESFSSEAVAEVINRSFVAIKVDREERPDIDQIYMNFVQQSTGHGGWPLNVFLTPELKPFFGGTYFPREGRAGLPGFVEVLEQVAGEWSNNRERIEGAADRIRDALVGMEGRSGAGEPAGRAQLEAAYRFFANAYDRERGGFGAAPKFPRPAILSFLLRQGNPEHRQRAVEMVSTTLGHMARGGIRDHLGGGFHRYSTDERWFLPHFEKMLYDQAQLAVAFLEAFQVTGDEEHARVARHIFEYVLRDLADPAGGFYSAEDADSLLAGGDGEEHAEGAFYVWSHDELEQVLDGDLPTFADYYGVDEKGNVARDPFGEFEGKNVLAVGATLTQVAERHRMSREEAARRLESSRRRLFAVRRSRPRPLLDDKILAAWNGLMISALSRGYQVLGDDRYRKAAVGCARFLKKELWQPERGRLLRRWRQGHAAIDGFLADYAFVTQGLLDLYESTLDPEWLEWALELTGQQQRHFADPAGGFFTAAADEALLLRMKDDYDGALPAANSVAALNLLRLGQMTGRQAFTESARRALTSFAALLRQAPQGLPLMLVGVGFDAGSPQQVLIAGDPGAPDTEALLREVHRRFLPHRVILLADGGSLQSRLAADLPVLDSLRRIDGRATAYLCRNYVCDLPTNDPVVAARLLDQAGGGGKPR